MKLALSLVLFADAPAKESYLSRLAAPDVLVQIGLLIVAAIGITVAIRTLNHMRESSEQQLRAYVVCYSASICNVANPVAIFPGQTFQPTSAEITNPAAGPAAFIEIKNTGQTPAFHVKHWGAICFREYPLTAGLPERLRSVSSHPCVLGPGITSNKMLELNPALTAQQIAALRGGTGAIYVYGEVTYRDAFKHERTTKYRFCHHRMGGAIGVSTNLSFTEDGNESD